MRYPFLLLTLLALVSAPVGCATPGPQGPIPLYEFDSVWFNPEIGGVRPWKHEDRRAATRAGAQTSLPVRQEVDAIVI